VQGGAGSTVTIEHSNQALVFDPDYFSTSIGDVVKVGFWLYGATVSGTTVTAKLVTSNPSTRDKSNLESWCSVAVR
jgi:hypothetical protein